MDKKTVDFEIQFYEQLLEKRPSFVDAMIPLAEAYTRKGLFEKGLEVDRKISLLCSEDPIVFYNLGCSYALTGRKKEALAALKKAILLGYIDFRHMKHDSDLKELHGNLQFQKLFSLKSGTKRKG